MTTAKRIWCLTLPLTEERPLSDDERRVLRRQHRAAVILAVIDFLGVPAAFAAMIGIMLLARDNVAVTMAAFIGGPVLVGLFLLLGVRKIGHLRHMREELRHGTVQCFAGRLADQDDGELEKIITRMINKAGFRPSGAENHIELYAGTGRVLRINGKAYRGWDLLLHRSETAGTPEIAEIAVEWLDKIGETEDGESIYGGQRELSPEELDELAKTAFTIWWRPLRSLLLIAIWPGMLALIALANGKPPTVPAVILLIFILFSSYPLLRGALFARALLAAASAGSVAIVRYPVPSGDESPPPTSHDDIVEMLLGTDIIWSMNGAPASWRRV